MLFTVFKNETKKKIQNKRHNSNNVHTIYMNGICSYSSKQPSNNKRGDKQLLAENEKTKK